MSKLKSPHKKKAINKFMSNQSVLYGQNTNGKNPKKQLLLKRNVKEETQRPHSKSTHQKERQSRFNQSRKREYCQAFSSSDIFAQNAASLSSTHDVDLHPYHCFQPSVIDQVG